MIKITLAACLAVSVLSSCTSNTTNITNGNREPVKIQTPRIYPIGTPVAGNYPQGLYKYPYRGTSLENELFTQTLEWSPQVSKTFAADTQYTAILTLNPASNYTFEGTTLAGISGLPVEGVEDEGISVENRNRSLIISIKFQKTADENAGAQIIFSDEFEGTSLNTDKWELCPEWDRQGRSSWRNDMVSVSGGYLHLKLKRDTNLGAEKSKDNAIANNWIRAGGVRTRKQEWPYPLLFDNGYGFYEVRIKFPIVSGTWGAFWLMSPTQHLLGDEGVDGTEIDIVESIHNENSEYNAALHWNGYDDKHKSVGSGEGAKPVNIYDGQFHTFALDWSPSEYVFYVDGKVFWRADGGAQFNNSGINQNPNYIKLTVEGAGWAGGLPPDFTEAEMLVDYVRVYNQPQNQN